MYFRLKSIKYIKPTPKNGKLLKVTFHGSNSVYRILINEGITRLKVHERADDYDVKQDPDKLEAFERFIKELHAII